MSSKENSSGLSFTQRYFGGLIGATNNTSYGQAPGSLRAEVISQLEDYRDLFAVHAQMLDDEDRELAIEALADTIRLYSDPSRDRGLLLGAVSRLLVAVGPVGLLEQGARELFQVIASEL